MEIHTMYQHGKGMKKPKFLKTITTELEKAELYKKVQIVQYLAWGAMLHVAEAGIKESISCELIDLQTLIPFDKETLSIPLKKQEGADST